MQRTFSAICATVTVTALAFDPIDAHGYVSSPHAQFVDPSTLSKYAMTITADVNSAFGGHKWDDSPEANVATFTSSFANTGYKSLREMLDQQVPGCANTRADISPVDVSGLTVMKWQNDEEHKGFIDSHHGPCEVWIDDTMVDHQDDCVAAYGSGYPANVKADFSQCSGNCILRFYWLALHEPKWQIYKQCVPIVNNSGTPTQQQVQPTVNNSDTPTQAEPTGTPMQQQVQPTVNNSDTPTQAEPTGTPMQQQVQPIVNNSDTPTQAQPSVHNSGTPTQLQFTDNYSEKQTPAEVQGTVVPAGPTSEIGKEASDGCQNRALRTIEDAPTHLANGVKINWTDSRFLRAFNEFASGFQMSD